MTNAWEFLRLTASWLWRKLFSTPYHTFMCRTLKKHEFVLYSVGHNFGKECRFCFHPGLLSEADIDEIQAGWPRYVCEEDEVVENGPESHQE